MNRDSYHIVFISIVIFLGGEVWPGKARVEDSCVSSLLSGFGVSGGEGVCYGCDIRIQYIYVRINHL